ncbi:hypothetical protein GCM10010278_33670 [Streptomyces melanogenes]|nr:hypothetical protein GCM10010278_33670 [Streptomyces melanogenes]
MTCGLDAGGTGFRLRDPDGGVVVLGPDREEAPTPCDLDEMSDLGRTFTPREVLPYAYKHANTFAPEGSAWPGS